MNFISIKLRGRYKLLHELGRGGFGTTYLALDEDLPGSPERVVKHLQFAHFSPTLLDFARHKFKQEAEVLYRLKHPQIPQLFAYFEEGNEFYLVQDYIQGEDLSKTELLPGKKLKEAEAHFYSMLTTFSSLSIKIPSMASQWHIPITGIGKKVLSNCYPI